jgi:uncharacterized protein (TIRG00374 family)
VGLLALLLRTVSPQLLGRAFADADYRYLVAALAPFLLTFAVKVTRWALLFGPAAPSWRTLFEAISVGYGVNTVVPLRAGELVTAYWVRDRADVSIIRTLGTIAVERVTDGVSVLTLLVLFAPTVSFPPALVVPTTVIGVLMVAALVGLAAVAWSSPVENGRLRRLLAHLERTPARIVIGALAQAVAGARTLRNRRTFSLYFAQTVLIWTSNSVLFWMLARAFHLDVPLSAGFLLTGVLFLGMAVPSSPGYLGVFDFLMVLTLGLYRVPHAPAVAAALAAHAVNFLPVTVVGLALLAHRGGTAAFGMIVSRQVPD